MIQFSARQWTLMNDGNGVIQQQWESLSAGRSMFATMLQSRTGLIFVATYLMAAVFLLRDGLTCTGMLCDLPAFLVLLPAGWVFYAVSNFVLGYDPDPLVGYNLVGHDLQRFIKWGFIIPSVLTNVIIIYFVGYLIGRSATRFIVRHGRH